MVFKRASVARWSSSASLLSPHTTFLPFILVFRESLLLQRSEQTLQTRVSLSSLAPLVRVIGQGMGLLIINTEKKKFALVCLFPKPILLPMGNLGHSMECKLPDIAYL